MTEEHKESWLKILAIIIAAFLGAFLAFYVVADLTFARMTSPAYHMKKMEKLMKKEQKQFERMEKDFGANPFEPKLAPMLVNLVKEPEEYKIIVDLEPLDNNENNVNVKLADNIVTVSGEIEKKEHHREDIMSFSQSYYLDEKIEADKMTKERKGNRYIITIPFED